MHFFIRKIEKFVRDEEGLTVVEYLIGAGLLVLALTGMGAFELLHESMTHTLSDENLNSIGGSS